MTGTLLLFGACLRACFRMGPKAVLSCGLVLDVAGAYCYKNEHEQVNSAVQCASFTRSAFIRMFSAFSQSLAQMTLRSQYHSRTVQFGQFEFGTSAGGRQTTIEQLAEQTPRFRTGSAGKHTRPPKSSASSPKQYHRIEAGVQQGRSYHTALQPRSSYAFASNRS